MLLHLLKRKLGVKLFEKEGRNVALTKCGQAFLIDVEQALDMIDSSVNKLQMTGRAKVVSISWNFVL